MAGHFSLDTYRSGSRLGKLAIHMRDLLDRLMGAPSLKPSPIVSRRQHLAAVMDAARGINRGGGR